LNDLDKLDELDLPEGERVMPRGERERRQAVLSMALANLDEKGKWMGRLRRIEPWAGRAPSSR
jgi:hypothetical protein